MIALFNILYQNHKFYAILNFFFKQAAVRAMDTIQHFVKAKLGNQVEKFFIAGASKASILYIERRRISPIRAHTKFYCNQMIENDGDCDIRNWNDDDDDDDELFLFDREGGQHGQQRL